MPERSQWHGHRLTVLPDGESWLHGGERRPSPATWAADPWSTDPRITGSTITGRAAWPFDDLAKLDALETGANQSDQRRDPVSAARSGRGGLLLAALGVAAIVTIFIGRQSGSGGGPGPLPAPPSQVVTSLTRAHLMPMTVHVGDYVNFQLPQGHSYSTVLEQPDANSPVVEAMTLPGQQPQLRADTAGSAVVEVMSGPICTNPDGCPDQSSLLGGIQLTVKP